jgi:hypothetical protein
MIPTLNKMPSQISGALAKYNKSFVTPGHALRSGPIELIFGKVFEFFKIFFVAI